MFKAEISEETLLSIPRIKGLSPEILLFKRKGTVSRDFSLRDGILPTLIRNILGSPLIQRLEEINSGTPTSAPISRVFFPCSTVTYLYSGSETVLNTTLLTSNVADPYTNPGKILCDPSQLHALSEKSNQKQKECFNSYFSPLGKGSFDTGIKHSFFTFIRVVTDLFLKISLQLLHFACNINH